QLRPTDAWAAFPSDYTFAGSAAGAHRFSVTLNTAGPQAISAQDQSTNSISGGLTDIAVNDPAPTTSGLSSTSAAEGSSTINLLVNGTNFVPASTVQWNGTPLATKFVSSAQLQATVPAADLI